PAVATDAGTLEHYLAARVGRGAFLVRGRCRWRNRGRQIGRGSGGDAAKIGDDGADVFRRELAQTVVDRFAHRARGRAAAPGVPGRKIGGEIVVAPAADAGRLVRADIEGAPARGDRAAEFFAVVQREGEIARRVALAAM